MKRKYIYSILLYQKTYAYRWTGTIQCYVAQGSTAFFQNEAQHTSTLWPSNFISRNLLKTKKMKDVHDIHNNIHEFQNNNAQKGPTEEKYTLYDSTYVKF